MKGVPRGVGGERWTCEPRVSGSSPEKVVNLDENSWTPTKIIKKRSFSEAQKH